MNELISGILLGGMYASVALGLTLVFGVMRLVNLAHGEVLVGAAYLTYFISSNLGLDPLVTLVMVVPAVMLVAYPVQRMLLNPLVAHGMEPPLVATFGLSIVAQTVFVLVFTSNAKSLTADYGLTGVDILGNVVRTILVIALAVGVVLVALTHLGLTRLRFGKALRAAAEDPEAAASLGIDVRHVYAATFAIAAALAAFGGVLIGVAFSIVPTTGLEWLLRAFTVIVLGGMGSVLGTLAGGIVIGIAEQYGALLFGPQYHNLIVFSLLVIVLVIRPQGLLGRKLTSVPAVPVSEAATLESLVGEPAEPGAAARAGARPAVKIALGVVIAGVIGAVFTGPQYLSLSNVVLAITLFTLMALAQSWNMIGGFGGQFSLGHAMFVGTGGYTTMLVLLHSGLPIFAAILLAGAISAGIGALAAIPLLRLRGVYFAVGSLGIALAAQSWMVNWKWAGQTSGVNLPPEAMLGFDAQYYMAAALALGTTAILVALVKSPFGLRLMAIRDDESAAAELGVNGYLVKLVTFALTAFLAGLAGASNAFQQLSLEPYSAFGLTFTINMIIACVIGGLSTFVGPLIGAVVIFELQQQLQDYQDWSTLIEGLLLIAIIRLVPGGIWGLIRVILVRGLAAAQLARARLAER